MYVNVRITTIQPTHPTPCFSFNPLTLMDGQDRISSYNVKQTSDEKIEKY